MGKHDRKVRVCNRPNFGKGFLYDVWFTAEGRNRLREKVSVTTDPESVKVWAFDVLQQLVKDRYGNGRIYEKGRWSKIEVTDRPKGTVVWSVRFDGKITTKKKG